MQFVHAVAVVQNLANFGNVTTASLTAASAIVGDLIYVCHSFSHHIEFYIN